MHPAGAPQSQNQAVQATSPVAKPAETPEAAESLKAFALSLGFQSVGIALPVEAPHLREYEAWLQKGYAGTMFYLEDHLALKRHPEELLPGCRSVIAVTLNYNQEPPANPRIARYALGRDYHKVLRAKLRKLAHHLQEQHPQATFRACVDSAPIFERDYARLAGLGFFGKNTMLIDPRRGSWFFIGLLLTTLELPADKPFDGGCGTCTACIEACPTGALVFEEGRWQLDARRCISYLTIEHRGPIDPGLEMGDWVFGCDVCQEVCPFNQPRESQPDRAQSTNERDFQRREWPHLQQLAQLTVGEWDELTQGSAVRRAGYEGLKRNAKKALENGGGAVPEGREPRL
jgi:epoxyqueuosine reductase